MTARAGVFALVLVVVLAGCFGNPGATPTDRTDPTSGPSNPSPTALGPVGVTNGTLSNVTALLDQYEGSLTNVGFVAEVRADNETIEYTYATDGSRMVRVDDGSTVIWTNGTASLMREVNGSNVTYSAPPEGVPSVAMLAQTSRIRSLLVAARYERSGTTQCGNNTCIVLTDVGSRNYENFTAEVRVDRFGVIHRFDAEYVRSTDGTRFEYLFTIRQLRTSSIDRPSWVEEGLNSTR